MVWGPVAQPGRVPDFYLQQERNPAVSGSNPDGPATEFRSNFGGSGVALEIFGHETVGPTIMMSVMLSTVIFWNILAPSGDAK